MSTSRTIRPHTGMRLAIAALTATVLATVVAGAASSPARADELVAADTSTAPVATVAGVIAAPAMTASASIPGGIVVTNHAGQPVSLYSKGQPTRHVAHPGGKPVTFTRLTPGRLYTVVVGGVKVGSLTAIARPTPASGLSVRTTDEPTSVTLAWKHRPTLATGGRGVSYLVTATSRTAPTLRSTVLGAVATTLTGLDRTALYTFTVVPRNAAGIGKGTRAVMTRTLDELRGTSTTTRAAVPVTAPAETIPAPVALTPTPAPAPAPGPAPAPKPSTKTIYVCPTGYTETAGGTCQKTAAYTYSHLPYTYTTLSYTFHQEATGPAPLLASFETANVCPSGYNLEDYGWVKYCRLYGPVPTTTVKDPTPAGYTDTGTGWTKKDPALAGYTDDGTQWTKKDAAPAGYTDDGTQWVSTVPKEAVVVPA